jgi:hypothetical protein
VDPASVNRMPADLISVATGYGQPPLTLYDWTLCASQNVDPSFQLPPDIKARLQIEQFSDKVTKTLYNNRRDPVGLSGEKERSALLSFLSRDFDDLEEQLKPEHDGTPSEDSRLQECY